MILKIVHAEFFNKPTPENLHSEEWPVLKLARGLGLDMVGVITGAEVGSEFNDAPRPGKEGGRAVRRGAEASQSQRGGDGSGLARMTHGNSGAAPRGGQSKVA